MQNNRAIFLESTIHAREWIAPATATYFLEQLLRSDDPDMKDLAENINWHILLITNPDGYEYTRNENRNWRKTRTPVSLTCWGVDPNRNFAHNWLIPDETGNEGASRAPCSDTYAGPRPFSEPEAAAMEQYLLEHHDKFDVYLSFHSYGHIILFPFGHTRERIVSFRFNAPMDVKQNLILSPTLTFINRLEMLRLQR